MKDINPRFRYLEVIHYASDTVVKRIDVTGMSDRQIERIENGLNINLNHAHYYTVEVPSEVELSLEVKPFPLE